MAYNEELANRIRLVLFPHTQYILEKKMMGGLTFMLHGNMCCGIVKDELMVRVIPSKYESVLNLPHCREMDFTGRPMKGFVFISQEGIRDEISLQFWIEHGIEVVEKILNEKRVK